MLCDNVLDIVLERVFEANPLLRLQFLSALGSRMHAAAARVLFHHITVEDDMRIYASFDAQTLGPLAAILHNAARYGPAVQRLTICDPKHFDNFEPQRSQDVSPLLQFSSSDESDDEGAQVHGNLIEPLNAAKIIQVLAACSDLTELEWSSTTPPPNGLCEALAHNNPKLVRFTFAPQPSLAPHSPQVPAHSRFVPPRWDGPSLPMLITLPVRALHLHSLSQAGARALGTLLSKLGDNSSIEELSLDFLWLDDALCDRIVQASKKLQRLCLSTSGTKLTDRGVLAVLEIDSLEELKLQEVEGRLSKRLWQKAHFPATLTRFSVDISEVGPHHSWISDHLASLAQVSFSSLTTLRIARTIHSFDCKLDDIATLQTLPSDFTISLKEAKALRVLECDWWAWPAERLKDAVDSCSRLEVLRVAFDGPFVKFLALTSTFAPASSLQTLHVYISPIHAPWTTSPNYSHPLTPSASPVVSSVATLPTAGISDASSVEENRSGTLGTAPDPHLPPIRDVKKFVRRCQALTLLEWYGWNGRGSWSVSRPPGVARSTVSVAIEHIPPPSPRRDLLQKYALQEEAARVGWLPGAAERQGHIWTGAQADEYTLELQAEQRREEFVTPIKAKTRKASNSSSSNPPVSPDVPGQPPTPVSSNKAFPLTPTSVRKNSTPADSWVAKPVSGHSRHRRATTESSLPGDSADRRLSEGPSGRRKSIGGRGKVANKSATPLNAPTRSATGSRQARSARVNSQVKELS